MIGQSFAGSYLPSGTRQPFWNYYDDRHIDVELAASDDAMQIARNERLAEYLVDPGAIGGMTPFAFYPPALKGAGERAIRIGARMTGGRTFLLDRDACREMGWPESVHFDLARAGWGAHKLEMRPEVKGAGTFFARTRLSGRKVHALLRHDPERLAHCASQAADDLPLLMMSLATFLKRPIGGQSEKCALQSVTTSRIQLGRSPIKFAPTLYAISQPDAVVHELRRLTRALPEESDRFGGTVACEVRLSPSTVRAIYFDSLEDEHDLARLVANVSTDPDELESTLEEMIKDVRRHLELMLDSTLPTDEGGFSWIKIGDVHEKFSPEGAARLRQQRRAWFLAKDDVIVRGAGKFFTDMESFFGRDVGYISRSRDALREHQTLFVLVILRDHLRVCAQFMLACEALRRGAVDIERRRAIARSVRSRICADVNRGAVARLEIGAAETRVEACYRGLGGEQETFRLPTAELALRG